MSSTPLVINPSRSQLDGFHDWLLENGRSPLTAKFYKRHVAGCAKTGIAARLTSRKLAPKTLHVIAASLRSYATYTDDGKLLVAVKKIRLPASRRAKPLSELPFAAWQALVAAIEADDKIKPEMRATFLIMALRGLRVGDVLRMKRVEIVAALETGRLGYEAKGRTRQEYGIKQIREALETLAAIDKRWICVADLISWRSKAAGEERLKITRDACLRHLKRIARTIELEGVYNHRLRRTYATHYLRQMKGDPQAIMKLQAHMGWQKLETAMGYVDAVNKDELEDLGENLIDSVRSKKSGKKR